jgi:peptidoglycan-associated lipoprotein
MKRVWLFTAVALCCCRHQVHGPASPATVDPGPQENHAAEIAPAPPRDAAKPHLEEVPAPPPARGEPGPPALDRGGAIALLNQQLRDAYFDYDRAAVRPDALSALDADARLLAPILADFPDVKITVEGHCDERGSAEYNMGLGANRASQAVETLARFGIAAERLETISYGKEAPQCTDANEACWRRNRRAHLVVH